MKRIITASLIAMVITPLLMATQCSNPGPSIGKYLVFVENKSDIAIDSLYTYVRVMDYLPEPEQDTLKWLCNRSKIKPKESGKLGHVTSLTYSCDDQYRFEIRNSVSEIVADTMITLAPIHQDDDDVKLILILTETGELHIEKQTIYVSDK